MHVSRYIHSCLLIEDDGDKILFDPGKFSFVEGFIKPDDFRSLSAIMLTHRHRDHVDDNALKKIIGNNPRAEVLTNTEIQSQLAKEGITTTVFETGRRTVGQFNLEAVEAQHAPILNAETPQRCKPYALVAPRWLPTDTLSFINQRNSMMPTRAARSTATRRRKSSHSD
jgi:L-ascorbate metabolism protein UlaG (beta-lactamase superfamily)